MQDTTVIRRRSARTWPTVQSRTTTPPRSILPLSVLLTTALLTALTGCHQPHVDRLDNFSLETDSERPRINFDDNDATWHEGDTVTYEVCRIDGTQRTTFFLQYEFTAVDPPTSAWPRNVSKSFSVQMSGKKQICQGRTMTTLIRVRRVDPDGTIRWESPCAFPWITLDPGLYPSLEAYRALARTPRRTDQAQNTTATRAEQRAFAPIAVGFISLMQGVFENRDLKGTGTNLVAHLVDIWSKLTVLTTGIRVDFRSFDGPRNARSIVAEEAVMLADRVLPGLTFGLVIKTAGRPIVTADLTTVPPAAPMHLCGGIVKVVGRSIRHPDRGFTIRLYAIQRNPTGAQIPRPDPPFTITWARNPDATD